MAEEGTGEKQEYQLKEPHTYKIVSSYMAESFEVGRAPGHLHALLQTLNAL